MAAEKKSDEFGESQGRYRMIVGGVVLVGPDGKIMTIARAAVDYQDLEYVHVQGLWRCINKSPALNSTMDATAHAAGPTFTALGDAYGLRTGKVTADQLQMLDRMMEG